METIKNLESSLDKSKTDSAAIDEYEIGTEKLENLRDEYTAYTTRMYNCIEDLYNKPGTDSFTASNDHLINVLLPQLRFINELTHVVNSFPHKQLPTTTAFLGELMERAKYKMANIKNFDAMVPVSSAVIAEVPKPGVVPYQQINGGGSSDEESGTDGSDNSDDGVLHVSDSESDHGDYIGSNSENGSRESYKRSAKNPENAPAIVLDTSSDEEPEKKESQSSSSTSSASSSSSNDSKQKKKKLTKKSKKSSKTKTHESSSSSSLITEQAGGMKRIRRRVRKSRN
jgi:hypothetical protein